MNTHTLQEIWEQLMQAQKILTTLHPSPDGDSLGSTTALKYILEKKGKKVDIVSKDRFDQNMQDMALTKEVDFSKDIAECNREEYDLILYLDIGNKDRISSKIREKYSIPENIKTINIDHHKTNTYFAKSNYVDSHAPSTCAILTDLCIQNNIEIDPELATRLLLGIVTDAGFFTHDFNVNESIHKTDVLIKKGARYFSDIIQPLLLNVPLKSEKLRAHVINNLDIDQDLHLGIVLISKSLLKEYNITENTAKLLISEVGKIKELDIVCFLRESEGGIQGSFRSKTKDISKVAVELGGGGHKGAAGFTLPNMTLEQAKQHVLNTIKNQKHLNV